MQRSRPDGAEIFPVEAVRFAAVAVPVRECHIRWLRGTPSAQRDDVIHLSFRALDLLLAYVALALVFLEQRVQCDSVALDLASLIAHCVYTVGPFTVRGSLQPKSLSASGLPLLRSVIRAALGRVQAMQFSDPGAHAHLATGETSISTSAVFVEVFQRLRNAAAAADFYGSRFFAISPNAALSARGTHRT